jgi:hypothetical protein
LSFSFAFAFADPGHDQPFYAVHPHGLIDPAIPDSIEAMAAERLAGGSRGATARPVCTGRSLRRRHGRTRDRATADA